MASVKWNKQQKQAIDAHGGTLLVSAAAGSGKTAVLSERVVCMLAGDNVDTAVNADRLLIVTFSNAAANEMRERIAKKLDERIEEDPTNSHLQRQRLLIQNADICTMHSFCARLVRENFHVLGLAPDFRIAEDDEIKVLYEETAQAVTESYYNNMTDGFARLLFLLAGRRNDNKVAKAVKKLAGMALDDPFPVRFVEKIRVLYSSGTGLWRDTVSRYAGEELAFAVKVCSRAAEKACESEETAKAFAGAFASDMEQFELLSAKCTCAEQFRGAFSGVKKARKGSTKKIADTQVVALLDAMRDTAWDAVKRAEGYFCCTEKEEKEDIEFMTPAIDTLCQMTIDYINELTKEKQRKNVLHFADLEHRAVELLVTEKDGELYRTDIAKEVSQGFDEILLDEYQDTSAVQDIIFKAVAKENGEKINDGEENLFMVGDIKQSIYRFRSAVSALFSGRFDRYCDYDEENEKFPARILLAKNYRSRPEVTDTINFIFRRLMKKKTADVDYTTQQLEAAASYPEGENTESELHILTKVEQEEGGDAHYTEAQFIARKIRTMIDEGFMVTDKQTGELRRARAGDFCVLRRSVKNEYGRAIAAELAKLKIDSVLSAESGFLDRPEVVTALSMLRVIDDPMQEIPLLTVLTSPMFGFSASELARIRLCMPKGNLYSALMKKASEGDDRCVRFIEFVTRYRLLAATWPGDRLISAMLRETGYMSAVMKLTSGINRRANLNLLIKYAEKYEGAGYKGITGFIGFIDNILSQENGDLAPAAPAAEGADAVRVMTIHKSKGLEFPVCIVCGLGATGRAEEKWMTLDNEMGIGMYRVSADERTKFETIQQKAIQVKENAAETGENIRLLYVALTRAKEKLIMVGTCSKPDEMLASAAALMDKDTMDMIPPNKKGAFLEWISACLMSHPDAYELRERSGMMYVASDSRYAVKACVHDKFELEVLRDSEAADAEEESKALPNDELMALIKERLEWKYPSAQLDIPSKVTASSLHAKSKKNVAASSRPAFMDEGGLTAVQRGSALHKFMELADCRGASEDIDSEIKRLADSGAMSAKEIKVLDRKKLSAFFDGEGGKMMREAEEILREENFSAVLPKEYHHLFTDADTDETIVIEGACDCVLVYDDHAVIIDYKSDRMNKKEEFAEDYGDQLRLYAAAMEQVLEKKITRTAIWSFNLSCFIDIK